jgi:hypothetical protein
MVNVRCGHSLYWGGNSVILRENAEGTAQQSAKENNSA